MCRISKDGTRGNGPAHIQAHQQYCAASAGTITCEGMMATQLDDLLSSDIINAVSMLDGEGDDNNDNDGLPSLRSLSLQSDDGTRLPPVRLSSLPKLSALDVTLAIDPPISHLQHQQQPEQHHITPVCSFAKLSTSPLPGCSVPNPFSTLTSFNGIKQPHGLCSPAILSKVSTMASVTATTASASQRQPPLFQSSAQSKQCAPLPVASQVKFSGAKVSPPNPGNATDYSTPTYDRATDKEINDMRRAVEHLGFVAHEPPPYSYAAITYNAIKAHKCADGNPRKHVSTNEIYSTIQEQYGFYRCKMNKGWKKTVRSTLSTLPCFRKVLKETRGNTKMFEWGVDDELARTQIRFTPIKRRKPKRNLRGKKYACGKSTI